VDDGHSLELGIGVASFTPVEAVEPGGLGGPTSNLHSPWVSDRYPKVPAPVNMLRTAELASDFGSKAISFSNKRLATCCGYSWG
jgi:hypothetical protein